MEWQAKWAGDLKFEVHHKNRMIMERFVVDLMAGRCSCRFWGLCGMPCPHACCAIFEKGDNPKDYCSNYYSKAAYLATYGQSISPINGENMWPKIQSPEGTQESDAAAGTGGGDAATNEPGAAVKANGSTTAPTARSRMVRERVRGRAAPLIAPASGPSNTPAPPSQPPQTPAPPSKPSNTPAPPLQPPHTPAPASQPATLPTPASLPATLLTPTSLSTAPASQPLPKTKIFGVRRSGRLKIGVRKATSQPPEHVDLTLD
ncbi:wiskott-Aldrich syndrome protein homolog 1-like [Arachis ipaensis]|uniref:wiskott-Aldrich syndrome protein homolog 1-like n=1 Tax=Arachis ipaensis TaxID=130454 RepID=UPI0007AF96D8|nr:wiskott-Aldrich syndrome protein homolog 1-like [Arachis ipaensis]